MRAVGTLGLALLCSVQIVCANTLRDVAFKALEARKVLVKPSAAGLTVVGYALPPAADDAAVLPDINNMLMSADGVSILNTDVLSASEAVGRGEYDAVLVPVTFDVDGVTVGKELAGFIKLEFIAPSHVKYKEVGASAKPVKAEPNVPTKSAIAIRDPMGIVIKEIGGLPEVAAIAEGGTFQKAGVVIGDILSHVNGVSVRDMPPSDAISFMKSSEFPRKLSFQRSPNSVLDMSAEMPEGSFTVIEPELLAGWTFSFTRALFGPLPTCDKLQIIHAVPTEGCRKQPLFVQTENGPPGILLTARGTCKFEDKAFVATESGASALFVSTTKDGDMPRMPVSAPTVKVAIPGMMISWEAGRVLAAAKVLHSPVVVLRDTEDCVSDEELQLLPTSPKMPPKSRRYNADESKGLGVVFAYTGDPAGFLEKFEFMTTKYGPSVGDLVPLARLVMAVPEDGCVPPGSALNNAQQIAGNIAVFVRGVCMFPDKTYAAQAARAVAVIVINTDKNLLRVPAPPELDPRSFRIPTVLVSKDFSSIIPEYPHQFQPMARMVMFDQA